jgi:type II secretory ATPase GspE/PulE/Tfp pilus assembly ATPase PilB-like protein
MNPKNQSNKPSVRTAGNQNTTLQSAEIQANPTRAKKKNSLYNVPKHRSEGTVASNKRSGFPLSTIICMFMMTVLVAMMINNFVTVNENKHEVAELRKEINELREEKDTLDSKLDQKNNYVTMEKYASSVLGMESTEGAQEIYIEVDQDETVNVYEVESDGTKGIIATVMSVLAENLLEALNVFTNQDIN